MKDPTVTKDFIPKYKKIFEELHRKLKEEDEFKRLKSRSLWLILGDKNTTFFHKLKNKGMKK